MLKRLIMLALLLSSCLAYGATAELTWTANTEPDLRGYRLYHSTQSGVYTEPPIFIPKPATNFTYQLPEPGPNAVTHYFRLTAIDDAADRNPPPNNIDNESQPSAEVSKVVPAIVHPPFGTPILTVDRVSETELVVSWHPFADGAGGLAKVDLRYQVGSPMQWGTARSAPCAASPCTITGLQPGTAYSLQAIGYRGTLNSSPVFGPFSAIMPIKTSDHPPAMPKGLEIVKASASEIQIKAAIADCPRITTSTKGSTATVLKRTVTCLK